MKSKDIVTFTLALGLATAPLAEAADELHPHTESDLQLLDANSINCVAPSITGQQLYKSEEELVLLAHANAAMARWWSEFSSGAKYGWGALNRTNAASLFQWFP